MRVLIATGAFAGPASPGEAAAAIASGWAQTAPADEIVLAPVSDGGTGFVDAMHTSCGGELIACAVSDAYGEVCPGTVLVVGDTAYVESAQAAAHRTDREPAGVHATSLGVGQLLAEALRAGVSRVVVGVGPTGYACNDGGAGLLAGLGLVQGPWADLAAGAAGLVGLAGLGEARLSGTLDGPGAAHVVLAADDEGPLLGLLGTTRRWGVSRGIPDEAVPGVDLALEGWAAAIGRRHALSPGSGAGGGIGFALLAAGATRAGGLSTVMSEVGLAGLAAQADLVITGEGVFEVTAGSGRVPAGVAAVAMSAIRPCIALTERSKMGAREMRALGVESVYSIEDLPPAERPAAGGVAALEALATRVARTWSWSR